MTMVWHQDSGQSKSNHWKVSGAFSSLTGCQLVLSTNTPHRTIFAKVKVEQGEQKTELGARFSKGQDATLKFDGELTIVVAYSLATGDPKIKIGNIGDTNFRPTPYVRWDDQHQYWEVSEDGEDFARISVGAVGPDMYIEAGDNGQCAKLYVGLENSDMSYHAALYVGDDYSVGTGKLWPCGSENPTSVRFGAPTTMLPSNTYEGTEECMLNYFSELANGEWRPV